MDSTVLSHTIARSPPCGGYEIVNTEEEERHAEDAAFQAEVAAYATKYDVHELAVRRLVEDLVEEDEPETPKVDVVRKHVLETSLHLNKVAVATTNHSHSQNGENTLHAASPLYGKRLHHKAAGGRGKAMYDSVRPEWKHDHMDVKPRTMWPSKSLPQVIHTTKPVKVSPPQSNFTNSSMKTLSTSKPPSRLTRSPKSGISVDKKAIHGEQRMLGQMKVKEFFQRRKSPRQKGACDVESITSNERCSVLVRENPDLGPYLLKLAKQAVASGDSPQKALDFATRAAKSYELAADGNPSLDLVMSLHVLAAIHCSMGSFEEALPILEYSIVTTDVEIGGQDHALAAFAGYMQLGDTFALLGKCEEALSAYHEGLELQMSTLGKKDPRVGETCRYLAEAHAQALLFDKAEELCLHALEIHKEHSAPASIEEATDRRLMGLIYNGKGQHELALEHLVLASMALITNGKDVDVAAVDASIGDTYIAIGRFDEAVFAYQKALTVFQAAKGENSVQVASVYVSLADVYVKAGKLRESRTYCESALRIYDKQGGSRDLDEVASGLTEVALVYETLNEHDHALSLLQKALSILEITPGQQSAVAGVEAQIGVLNYTRGNFTEAHTSFSKAVSTLRASAEKNSCLLGIALNHLGLTCVQLSDVEAAANCFEESTGILQAAYGPHHLETISVYSNLAGAYDALGRLEDAINVLQYILEVREEKLGTAAPEVEEERGRVAELLKEAGRLRSRRANGTLDVPDAKPPFALGEQASLLQQTIRGSMV